MIITADYWQNVRRSLRVYVYNLDTTIKWYLDTINETATEDVFGIVKTSTQGFEDGEFRRDFINLNIFAKTLTDAEATAAKIFAGINSHYVEVKNYIESVRDEESLVRIGTIGIRDIEWNNVGNTEGYYQINLTVNYEY